MKPTRRQVLAAGAASPLAACVGLGGAPASSDADFDGAALHADVRRYVELARPEDGHRTGTPSDLATLDWMEGRLKDLGFAFERIETPAPVFRPSVARTSIGRIRRGGGTVVVSTPASGWFACGGERGPGIALWLALADWAAKGGLTSSLVFVVNSGHELGDLGAHQFLEKAAPPKDQVRLWLHLGAGIATYDWHETNPLRRLPSPDPQRYLLASRPILEAARRAFAGQPGLEQVYEATVEQAAGELRPILAAGYDRAAGIFAGHRFHHVPTDDADKTGPELLRPVARALAAFARAAETEKDSL